MNDPASRTALLLLIVVAPVAVGCGNSTALPVSDKLTPVPSAAGVITFGSVSVNPAHEYEVFRPFANYVAAQLGDVGIGRGRVVVAGSLSQMVEEVRSGKVDVYIDSPFPAGFLWQQSGAVPILRRWKRGTDVYRSVIFARTDSGVQSIADLAGKMVAFGAPFSTTGYLVPKATMTSAGLNLVNYADRAASVPSDRVGYIFSNDAENTVFWVLKKKVTAGAINADYFEEFAGNRVGELIILQTSESVPRNVVCVRPGLDSNVLQALETVLLKMHLTDEGQEALRAFEETVRFDRFPGGAEQALENIMKLLPHVEDDLGE